MSYKERIKNFFIRFKRLMVFGGVLALAIAVIGIVAYSSSMNVSLNTNQTVQTSAPTTVSFIMPVKDGVIVKDFSNTSLKYNSTLKQWESHKAVDIKSSDDSDVMAVMAGEIVSVENNYLKGTIITIKHNKSLQTVYSSLAEDVKVKVGDKVKQGTVIGKVSTSAKGESADGAHLHFEVLVDNVKVDPNLYLNTGDK
ncbi:MAG: M23 family metallopeptidase [Clostridia bacterium]|nr:M23 family metallopeptidase [Clostridia bacterium]